MNQPETTSSAARSRRPRHAFPDLSPIDEAPSLTTLNTMGFKLYGKSDYDADTDSYMTTQYFVVLFLPMFPVARYRVISDDGTSYRFLGKGKLRAFEWIHLAIVAGFVLYPVRNAGLK